MGARKEIVETKIAVAKYFGVTRVTVYRWCKEGMPIEENGTYNLKKIGNWNKKRKNKVKRYHPNDLPEGTRKDIISMKENTDKTNAEVARIFQVKPRTVDKIWKKYTSERPFGELYKKNRPDLFSITQGKLQMGIDTVLESFTQEEIDSMTPEQKGRLLANFDAVRANVYRDERIERGESTENVAVIVGAINEWKKLKESRNSAQN